MKKGTKAVLMDAAALLGGRPLLVERAAATLALFPEATIDRVVGEIANAPPAIISEQLAGASKQGLKILAHAAGLALPADAGTIARAANVSASVVSTQMARLADIGLVAVQRSAGRDHRYDFADPVVKTLYRAMTDIAEIEQFDDPASNAG